VLIGTNSYCLQRGFNYALPSCKCRQTASGHSDKKTSRAVKAAPKLFLGAASPLSAPVFTQNPDEMREGGKWLDDRVDTRGKVGRTSDAQ
jgi:hypothetical protein